MKHFCPISGLNWTSPFLESSPITVLKHPIFSLPYKELIKVTEAQFLDTRQTYSSTGFQASQYLILVATALQLPIEVRRPLDCSKAFSVLLSNQDRLIRAVTHAVKFPATDFPALVITSQNHNLGNFTAYLELIEDVIQNHTRQMREQSKVNKVQAKENTLQRILYSQSRMGISALSRLLPDWADLVCDFPRFKITRNDGSEIPLNEAYKEIIRLSVLKDHHSILISYSYEDIQELISDCEDSLELGTAFASRVLEVLRESAQVLEEFGGVESKKPEMDILNLDLLDSPTEPRVIRELVQDKNAPSAPNMTAAERIKALLSKRLGK